MATRTQLIRLIPLTCSLLQFSPNTAANCGREQSLAPGKVTETTIGEQSPPTEPCRVELPKELEKDVIELSCESTTKGGVCDVYLVGVVHNSKESIKQVESIIKFLKPDTVFLELCESRLPMLFHEKYQAPTVEEMIALRKQKYSIFQILRFWSKYQLYSMLDISFPGAEFRSASREADKYGGRVVLGDRPQEITDKRKWNKLPLWHIPRYFIPCFPSNFSVSLSISDNLENWRELHMSKRLPTIIETIRHERDKYMSHTLLTLASESRTIVAVVGKGHLEGMKKNWKQPVKDIHDLLTVPPPNPTMPAMRTLAISGIVMVGVAVIIYL